MVKRVLFVLVAVILWSKAVVAETYYFQAPSEGSYATALGNAITNASNDDVFVLTTSGGSYIFNAAVTISANITIKAEKGIQRPLIQQESSSANAVFEVINNGSLHLISLVLSGQNTSGMHDNGIVIRSTSDAYNNYALIARNCIFNNLNNNAALAQLATHGDNILFENCYFDVVRSIDFNLTDATKEASFDQLTLNSCVFTNCNSGAFYLSEKADESHGSVFIDHCSFDSVSRESTEKILSINGASDITVTNSSFSNSNTNPSPFELSAEAELDYCNFYSCADWGTSTGANCLYYNPQYDSLFFITNPSLLARGNDGQNIGPLEWVYTGEEDKDTIDKGDNPHGFTNQGVWIVPQQDSTGKWESYFLKYDRNGKLKYRQDTMGDVIPDFSYVGYKRGSINIPNVDVVATIYPIEGDASDKIQRIIDSVGANTPLNSEGIRGAILIKAGQYKLSKNIVIKYNGIVIRGEGESEEGTVLTATSTSGSESNNTKLIKLGASSGTLSKIISSKQQIAVPYIPVGAKYVIIPSGNDYAVGDHICIYQQFNNAWISDIKMDQIPPDGGELNQWVASDYTFNYEREVNRISSGPFGDSLFFYNPIVMALTAQYNLYREVYKCTFNERISNSGVENMLLKSVYASNEDENHTWDAVFVDRAEDCWVQNVTSKHFAYSCVNISSSARQITVTNCTSLSPKSEVTGSRRYSFNCDGQTSLFSYCHASEGRHDYITGAKVCGPNVFTNCTAVDASNDIGPHHRWAVGTLYDVVTTEGEMNVRDRASMGTGHGWAGANQVLWNSKAATGICQNPWASAKNYAIGFTGTYVDYTAFGNRPRGEWEGANVSGLHPHSLYIAQKQDRNAYNDFSLVNNQLIYINDSTFQLKFNQTVDPTTATTVANYSASGSAGIAGIPDKATIIDSITIEIAYSSFGLLKGNTKVTVEVSQVENVYDDVINGITTASLTVPKLEPKVSMNNQLVTNAEDQFAIAQSTKDGDIFLIYISQNPETINDLETALSNNLGAVTRDIIANTDVQISTFNLGEGYYYAYATDIDGRVSSKSTKSITVENSSSVNNTTLLSFEPKIFHANNKINISLSQTQFNAAKFELYDLNGKLILSEKLHYSESVLDANIQEAVYLARLMVDNSLFCKKIIVTN